MLTRLHLQNFTVFADADFHFSPGLNVLVGTNGTGKSHVLKVGYALLGAQSDHSGGGTKSTPSNHVTSLGWDLLMRMAVKGALFGDLSSNGLSLVRRGAVGEAKAAATILGDDQSVAEVQFDVAHLNDKLTASDGRASDVVVRFPVFIPPKEVLTMLTDIEPLMREYTIRVDSTYLNFWNQLRRPRRLRLPDAEAGQVKTLDDEVGGQLDNDGNAFYVVAPDGKRLPVILEAEGKRKFAALSTLLANGSLTPETTLFWDEPEANLNPALLKKLAAVLATLARAGFQIILATHSLFLLKELHILSRDKAAGALPIKYFGLNADQPGDPVRVTAVNDFELLPNIVALEEELTQADELEIIFATEDRNARAHD